MSVEIIENLPMAEYHEGHELSRSELWRLIEYSPHHAITKDELPDSPAFKFGRYYHRLLFQPDTITDFYVILPEGLDLRTKEGKRLKIEAEDQNMEIVKADDAETASKMLQVVETHEKAPAYIQGGIAEASILFDIPGFDPLRGKARPDYWISDLNLIVDLKTTVDARSRLFSTASYRYGYHVQAAWYTYAAELAAGHANDFIFLVQEKDPPYELMIYRASDEMMIEGRRVIFEEALPKYLECYTKDDWPGYSSDLIDLELPGWLMKQRDNAIWETF